MTDEPRIGLDHVGIAVESIDDAASLLSLLGEPAGPVSGGDHGDYRWVHYELDHGSRIELIEPVEGTESFLTEYLDRYGPGLHHVTLAVDDLEATVERLAAAGVRVVDRQRTEHREIAYVSPRNPTGALFQLEEPLG